MKVEGMTSGWVFAANPVVVTDPTECRSDGTGRVSVYVHERREAAYIAAARWPLSLDIAEIIGAHTPPIPEVAADNTAPLVCLEDASEVSALRGATVSAYTPDGDELDGVYLSVLPGGIPRGSLRVYSAAGTDVFAARLLEPRGNFFLTVRCADWRIVVRETELSPLYFVAGWQGPLSVRSACTGRTLDLGRVDRHGVYALDMQAVRRVFCEELSELPSVLDVIAGDGPACRIVVEHTPAAVESYRLRFRNSMGGFDTLWLAGEMTVGLSPGDDGDTDTYADYDPTTGAFSRRRDRRHLPAVLEINTLIGRDGDRLLLADLLCSEEVYLLDVSGSPLRVIPECDDFASALRPVAPVGITVRLAIADDDCRLVPRVTSPEQSAWRRLFSTDFANQFD